MCARGEGGSQLVVWVDDDPAYLRAMRRNLARYRRQVELVLLPSASDAFAYVPKRAIDLFVLDEQVEGGSGIAACRQLRASGLSCPVAVTSEAMTHELELAAFDAGATHAVAKAGVVALINLREIPPATTPELEQLIGDHIDVARNIARTLARRFAWMLDPEDVAGAAMVGLCEAAERFDPGRVASFIAFAEQRIRGAIFDEIRRLSSYGRIVNARHRRITTARLQILQRGGDPTDDRVAELLGLSVATVQRAGERRTQVGIEDAESLPAPGASPEAHAAGAQFLRYLSRARETLPHHEANVIRLHYDVGMSLAEIARTLELSLARVRSLHTAGLATLRQRMDNDTERQRT